MSYEQCLGQAVPLKKLEDALERAVFNLAVTEKVVPARPIASLHQLDLVAEKASARYVTAERHDPQFLPLLRLHLATSPHCRRPLGLSLRIASAFGL